MKDPGYPTERCVECTLMVMHAPGLTCNECLRHMGKLAGLSPDPAPPECWIPEFHPWGCHCLRK